MPLRLIICGGRDFCDMAAVYATLDRIHQLRGIVEIIHGSAPGADSLAGQWARIKGIKETPRPADWNSHGRAAGPKRNRHMLTLKPDGVVAFPGGRGTTDMIQAAEDAGVPVMRVGIASSQGSKDVDTK